MINIKFYLKDHSTYKIHIYNVSILINKQHTNFTLQIEQNTLINEKI